MKTGSWHTTGLRDVSVIKKFFWDTINNRNKVSLNLLKESDLEEYHVGEDCILVVHVPVADRTAQPGYFNSWKTADASWGRIRATQRKFNENV